MCNPEYMKMNRNEALKLYQDIRSLDTSTVVVISPNFRGRGVVY